MDSHDIDNIYKEYWVEWRKTQTKYYKLLRPSPTEILLNNIKAKLDKAVSLKEAGNGFFRNQDYNEAIQKYIESIETVPKELFETHYSEDYSKLKLAIITNMCICFYKLKNYQATVLQCEEGLKMFPMNVKLRYILGGVLGDIEDFEKALAVLKDAKVLDPGNRDVIERIKNISQLRKQYKLKMKEMFGGKLQPVKKTVQIEQPPPAERDTKTHNNGMYYLIGALSVIGIAGFLFRKYR